MMHHVPRTEVNPEKATQKNIMDLNKLIELLELPPNSTEEAVVATIAKGQAALARLSIFGPKK